MTENARLTQEQLLAAEARLLDMMDAGARPEDGIAEMTDDDLLLEFTAIHRLLVRMGKA